MLRRIVSSLYPAALPVLKPVSSISIAGQAPHECDTQNNNSLFHIQNCLAFPYEPGWYMVEIKLTGEFGRETTKLYFDFGRGTTAQKIINIPVMHGVVYKKLVYISSKPTAIYIQPLSNPEPFKVAKLRLAPVTKRFATDRMLKRITIHFYRLSSQNNDYALTKLSLRAKTESKPLLDIIHATYESTFVIRNMSIDYSQWIATLEKNSKNAKNRNGINCFTHKPLISVIMPVYNSTPEFLHRAIESVQNQSYPIWELCIADDASTNPKVHKILQQYSSQDKRIRVVYRATNGHISNASNSALDISKGDYIALLDHDDELAEHALYAIANEINNSPEIKIIYSDEDKIDSVGDRYDPHFKSDWNPDLFLAHNYIAHLCVYRKDLLLKINGFRQGIEGSQDYDLMLRCLPHVAKTEITHIPEILYHWRATDNSTALSPDKKTYTTTAGLKALSNYFYSIGKKVTVTTGLLPNTYRITYPIPATKPIVSLIIPTRDKLYLVKQCVESILNKTTYAEYEIIIIDNQSQERETLDWLDQINSSNERVRVICYNKTFNYSAINNFGVSHAKGDIVGLINNDIKVINNCWLTEMVAHACRPDIGCVGAKLYYRNDQIQHAGVILGIGGVAGHSHKYFGRHEHGYFSRLKLVQNLSAVTGACLLVRKSIYNQVGGLDEKNLKIAFNDVDFCLKVGEAGYRNLWTPYAELYHYESISRGVEDTASKQHRFQQEVKHMQKCWAGKLAVDPYYNPNLTLKIEDFSIAPITHESSAY